MLLLGFGNKARNGKDTAGEAIRDFFEDRNTLVRNHLGAHTNIVKVGIFKYATALYAEVNEWLKQTENFGKEPGQLYFITDENNKVRPIPSWVQPESNPEVSELTPYGKHPKLLQYWGTEFRRTQDENYWVKRLFASIPANLDIAIITDVRFPNEVSGVREKGGYTVNVQRLREDGTQYYSSDRPSDHPSEIAVDDPKYWDFYLKIPNGHAALLGEFAITLAQYLRGLHK